MAYYVGIDVGTSGTKALLTDAKAKVLATATAEHPIYAPKPGWSEQKPDQWWASSKKAIRAAIKKAKINPRQVAGIGLSGQMHGLVLTDDAGRPLRPALIWNDQRTAAEAEEIHRAVGGPRKLISLVGNVAMTSFTLTKLLWVRKHEPKIYEKARHLLLPKDYIRLRLTGEYVGEVSDMSGTLMLNQKTRNWSPKIISTFDLDADYLPPVVESRDVTGRVTASAANDLGIAAGTPVVGGGGDNQAAAVGNGIVRSGLCSASIGTSGVVYVHSKDYVTDPQGRVQTFCASVAGQYCLFGCILSAGGSFQWFRNTLGGPEVAAAKKKKVDPYELLTDAAAEAPPGCEGVFFLPYLTGERTPHADPAAKACWVGMHSRTGRNELIRSVMEGATFAMNDAVTIMRDRGLRPRSIHLTGGGARSEFWRQLQADVYGATCVTINAEEGPAYGAAILAAIGTGRFKNARQACDAAVKITRKIRPNPKSKRLYKKLYDQYRRLYPALKDEFARINELPL